MNLTKRLERLKELYEQMPKVLCKQKCQGACGIIKWSWIEKQLVDRSVGGLPMLKLQKDGSCPLLMEGMCSVYEVRPWICRLWGAIPDLKCEHGCEVIGGWSPEKQHVMFQELKELSEGRTMLMVSNVREVS